MHVTILVCDHCSAASASIAVELFAAANHFSGSDSPIFNVTVASLSGQDVSAVGGQRFRVDGALANIESTDLVVVPGFIFTLKDVLPAFPSYGEWLTKQHSQGATIAAMCTAAFMLAENNLLNSLRATTHWAFSEYFERRYPSVNLDSKLILCEDNRFVTSAGSTAALDLLLHVIRRFSTDELAITCSRYLLIDSSPKEQTCYALWSMPKSHGDLKVLEVQNWLDEHLGDSIVIDDVAHQFGFGVRNFKRRFKEATGYTPINYLQTIRLERAKKLLESTNLGFDTITYKVGYVDSSSFRQLFSKRVGLLPIAYRKKFQGKNI